jgi:biofilm protein TabA
MLFVLISVVIKNSALAQTDQKDAKKWLRSKEWRQGITMKPHSSVNADEFYKQYYANQPVWDKVFTFLKTQDLEKLAPGKYPIDGDNAYATITLAPSKQFDQTNWESHKKYIDLHYVISGEEKIGVAPVSTATVIKTYDDTKDVANYTVDGTFYVASPGRFFLFFPEDAHRPSIKVNDVIQVKKLVIKIKMAN